MVTIVTNIIICKGGRVMATSSIKKTFVVSGQKQAEKFADAIEAAMNNKTPIAPVKARYITDSADIKKFFAQRNEQK